MSERRKQAAEYAALLYSGQLTSGDQSALESWIEADPDNADAYLEMADLWHNLGALSHHLPELERAERPRSVSPARRIYRWLGGVAAMVMIGLGLMLFQGVADDRVEEGQLSRYQTGTGERVTVQLEDGSTIVLNTNSRVIVDFSDLVRRIALLEGEVFVEANEDPSRPLRVEAGGRSVTVLGTKFGVRRSGLSLIVGVSEGVVAVHSGQHLLSSENLNLLVPGVSIEVGKRAGFKLSSGTIARFDVTGGRVSAEDLGNAARYPNWRYGFLRFKNCSLQDVVREINRYAVRKVLIEDASIMDLPISAVFDLNDLDTAWAGVQGAFPVVVARHQDRVVLTGSKIK